MSSPSSTHKRKRGGTASTRDATGEDMAVPTTSPAANTRHRKQVSIDTTPAQPPSKRARTRSSASGKAPKVETTADDEEDEDDVDDEPSSTSESSEEREIKPLRRSSRSQTMRNGGDKKDDGLDDTERRMEAPPKAGQRDPIGGYKTNPPPTGRAVRIYADGVFDLFHLGHMRQLQQAKSAFPTVTLIVGVTGDVETHRRKGLTVLTGQERAETVRHCKWVDEVIPNCPWIVTSEFLSEHNIDYVAHDDEPYGAAEGDDIYARIKEEGRFLVTERTEGVSTTGIITKIVKDYEKYISRQLKRGTSRQELNVSWLKKNELDIKRHVGELRDSIRQNWTSAGGEIGKDLKKFWEQAGISISRPNSPAPSLGRTLSSRDNGSGSGAKSPVALEHMKHLEIPGGMGTPSRALSPGALSVSSRMRNDDFAAGYSLGLLGSVRSWMGRTRRSLRDSQHNSPEGTDEEDLRSPEPEMGDPVSPSFSVPRGRKGKSGDDGLKGPDAMDVLH